MNSKEIQSQLKNIRIKSLNTLEHEKVWENVRLRMQNSELIEKVPKKSRFSTFKKTIAVTLIFGMTAGTAFAADSAKPGDTLFALDRALENLQLSVSSANKKDSLKVKFAMERVSEVKDILKEVSVQPANTSIKTAPVEELPKETKDGTIPPSAPQEVSENNPVKTQTETPATFSLEENSTEDSAEDTTQEKEATTTNDVFEENQKSASSSEIAIKKESPDKETAEVVQSLLANISDGDKARIELALGTALSFLGDVKEELVTQGNDDAVSYIDFMLGQLNEQIDTLPNNVTFEINLSAKKERVAFEVTSKDNKPQVQIEVNEEEVVENVTSEDKSETEKSTPPQTKKLEIKDGSLSIKETSDKNESGEGSTEEEKEDSNEKQSTTTKDILPEKSSTTTPETIDEENTDEDTDIENKEDGTTTVKVIIKKLENDFELSVTDKDSGIHDIIEGITEKAEEKEV